MRRSLPRRARSWRAFPRKSAILRSGSTPNLRLAEAEAALAAVGGAVEEAAGVAPASSDLQNAVHRLSEPSKRIVLRFVYERALDARELTAPNFLGLAAIDLDEGDVPGAVALLKRLTLISGNPYADADSAASLLEIAAQVLPRRSSFFSRLRRLSRGMRATRFGLPSPCWPATHIAAGSADC